MTSAADELDELSDQPPSEEPLEAPERSELTSLRDRVAKAKSVRFDLQVPGLDPPVFVRYRPVTPQAMEQTFKRTEQLRKDRTVITNAIILADHCEGVFELDENGDKVSVDPDDRQGAWPKFGPQLAQILGLPPMKDGKKLRAVDVVRGLYPLEGDIISTSQDLAVRSGYAREQIELETEGN